MLWQVCFGLSSLLCSCSVSCRHLSSHEGKPDSPNAETISSKLDSLFTTTWTLTNPYLINNKAIHHIAGGSPSCHSLTKPHFTVSMTLRVHGTLTKIFRSLNFILTYTTAPRTPINRTRQDNTLPPTQSSAVQEPSGPQDLLSRFNRLQMAPATLQQLLKRVVNRSSGQNHVICPLQTHHCPSMFREYSLDCLTQCSLPGTRKESTC